MRGLAHPIRLALIEALTFYGPLTATQAGDRIDESPTTCSFHLRQLAKYRLIEEAGGGRGRERPWRMRRMGVAVSQEPGDVEQDVAGQAFLAAALARQLDRHAEARRNRGAYPDPWRSVVMQNETVCWVTADEAIELGEQVRALVHSFQERLDPERRPDNARPVELLALLHPFESPDEYR